MGKSKLTYVFIASKRADREQTPFWRSMFRSLGQAKDHASELVPPEWDENYEKSLNRAPQWEEVEWNANGECTHWRKNTGRDGTIGLDIYLLPVQATFLRIPRPYGYGGIGSAPLPEENHAHG